MKRMETDESNALPISWMQARHHLATIQRAAEQLNEHAARHSELRDLLGAFPGLVEESARAFRERLRKEDDCG